MSEKKYEYLDHTADVQLHSWGDNFAEALEQLILSMYGYMADGLSQVEEVYPMEFEAQGQDASSLVFNILTECLYGFTAEPFFIAKSVSATQVDLKSFKVSVKCLGDSFTLSKHLAGTEIKAITYSNLQVLEKGDRCDIYVVVDIWLFCCYYLFKINGLEMNVNVEKKVLNRKLKRQRRSKPKDHEEDEPQAKKPVQEVEEDLEEVQNGVEYHEEGKIKHFFSFRKVNF